MQTQGVIDRKPVAELGQFESFKAAVRAQVECILHSPHFDASGRSRDFFRFIVDEALCDRADTLSQTVIAMAVFGRERDFDAILDPIVRVQAGRLRRSLERYYLLSDNTDSIRIAIPKGAYAPVFLTAMAKQEERGRDTKVSSVMLTKVVPEQPTVIIHSFDDTLSQHAEVATRMTEGLTMELCRFGDVRVVRAGDIGEIAFNENTQARFELRGSLRRINNEYVVVARLVDRSTSVQIWSGEYHTESKMGCWSSSVPEIARIIAAYIGAEHGVIVRALTAEHFALGAEQGADSTDEFGAILRCYRFFNSGHVGELIPAIEALQQALARQPENAMAWTCLARLTLANYSYELCDLQTPIDKTIGYAHQASIFDPANVRVSCVLAKSLLVKGELQSALDELNQVLRLNSESLVYREVVGLLLALAGDWDRGMALIRETIERNPYCLPQVRFALWADHLRRGEFDKAYVAALKHWDASFFWHDLMVACCLGHLGRFNEAQASVAELLRVKPNISERGRTLIGYYIKSADLHEQIVTGLRKAGLSLR